MDVNTITSLISTLGFPIVCCVYMAWSQQKTQTSHKEEIDKLRETVENNTKVMIKLCTKLGIDTED